MIVLSSVLFVIALVWFALPSLRAVMQVLTRPAPDRPATLVDVAARHLAPERPEWAQAMLAEIGHVRGAGARWRFALGCAQVVLFSPHTVDRSRQMLRSAVMVGVLGTALTAVYGTTRSVDKSFEMNASVWVTLMVVLMVYSGLTLALTQATTRWAVVARRLGLVGGVAVGILLLLLNSPASPFGNLTMRAGPTSNPFGGVTPLLVSLVVAVAAAWLTRNARAGVEAALWTGMVGSLVFCVGLMTLTYSATAWFTSDPVTLASWAYSWSSLHYPEYQQHYRDVGTYLIRENADTAFVSLLFGPAVSITFGLVGGPLGSVLRRLRTTAGAV